MKYRDFIRILQAAGFRCIRVNGSHHQYEGHHGGQRWMVTVAYHQLSDEILPKNFASMIRQSGLPKKRFR